MNEFDCFFCQQKFSTDTPTYVNWCPSCIVLAPFEWLEMNKHSRKKYEGYKYLVTFTRNENGRYTKKEWLDRVCKELRRKAFSLAVGELEHIDTNIHCHAVIETGKAVHKSLFKVFIRDYGFVDLRRINIDNGVQTYIEKELPQYSSVLDADQLHAKYTDLLSDT